MKHKEKLSKALLSCGLLLYATSLFLPWLKSSILGGDVVVYWSFKARIYPYPYPDFRPAYEEVYFHSPWFVSQVLTLLFGLLTFLKNVNGKYGFAFLGLTLLFSTIPVGTSILTAYASETRILAFLTGFWIAIIAFMVLFASLLMRMHRVDEKR